MKNLNLIISILSLFIITSCFDNEEDILNPAAKKEGQIPTISNVNPGVFDSNDLQNTYVEFQVSVDDANAIEQAIVQVSYNEQFERVTFDTFNTFPATIRVTLADVAASLGLSLSEVQLGDLFTIEILTVSNGVTTRSSANVNASVVCAYNPTAVSGSYHSVSADWASEGDITITVDEDDPFIVYVSGLEEMEGLVEDQGPLKMVINPVDYSISVDRQVLASSLDPWGLSYTNLAYEGSGTLNTCTGTYEMLFEISVDQGSWGTNAFTFTPN
ncbi:hypothetical protein [Mangrovibacterium lignilyticum]|uniref:hypothetical protein n=1 Tax=Mangrovibacterium lignilyticum TaxID=2668052 RepID=UPI0013D51E6F|nr:hypothetical protein [Mangrovibacterium lignilyticum]